MNSETKRQHIPSVPVHPGEIIKEEIECRGISQRALAREIGMSATQLNEIINGRRAVTAACALLLEAALGIDSDLLTGMQATYNKQIALQDPDLIERLSKIRRIAAAL